MNDKATALAQVPHKPSLVAKFADRYGVDSAKLLTTLKDTAFKQRSGEQITNEQMMALLIVADQYKLNPFTKEIYAFPDKQNGIVPVIGVDGWSRLINSHPQFDGMTFEAIGEIVDKPGAKPCPEEIRCIIYRKDRAHPIAVSEYFDECYREPFKTRDGKTINGPWQSHTKRMLRHKVMIQCARVAFGFVGVYDEDEAERIVGAGVADGAGGVTDVPSLKEQVRRKSAPEPDPEIIDGELVDESEYSLETLLAMVAECTDDGELDYVAGLAAEHHCGGEKAAITRAIKSRLAEIEAGQPDQASA